MKFVEYLQTDDPAPRLAAVSQVELRFVVPDEQKSGTYADVVGVWHNQHGFTLDFAALDRTRQTDEGHKVDANVVARLKIPASVVFQIAKAIADNVNKYEQRYGPITPPPSDEPSAPPGGPDDGRDT